MSELIARARTISDINVTEFDAGQSGAGIRVDWLDEAGARLTATRFGLTARRWITDIHAAEVAGNVCWRFFLTGLIRGIADDGGLDP